MKMIVEVSRTIEYGPNSGGMIASLLRSLAALTAARMHLGSALVVETDDPEMAQIIERLLHAVDREYLVLPQPAEISDERLRAAGIVIPDETERQAFSGQLVGGLVEQPVDWLSAGPTQEQLADWQAALPLDGGLPGLIRVAMTQIAIPKKGGQGDAGAAG